MKKTTAVVMAVVTGADTVEAAVDTEVEEEEVDTEGVVAACRDQVEGDGEVDLSRFCQEETSRGVTAVVWVEEEVWVVVVWATAVELEGTLNQEPVSPST